MSSVSNGLYFLTLPLVSVMRVWGARYTLGARYLSKNTVLTAQINAQNKYYVTHSVVAHLTQVFIGKGKGKGKVHLRTDHEDPNGGVEV